ncbi:phosphoadenylyl-sulfate reductase [Rhizobium sp. CRIBSB]|nr:phosphoadenylyl-sulfate reductase [Rhizobium sp. CRIBSB]
MLWLETPAEGERVLASTPLEDVEALVQGRDALIIVFEAFRDGRGFSLASVLRERGWRGRLTAAGDLLPDQARHLQRSGFDAVELPPGSDVADWARMLGAFTTVYQAATDRAVPAWRQRHVPAGPTGPANLEVLAQALNASLADADPLTVLRTVLDPTLGLRTAVLSSFGAEAAVLLDHVGQVDPTTPVLFLDTGQHFLQTLSYRKQLSEALGLSDVRIVVPDAGERASIDPADTLWRNDPDACCDLRKVRPLARASTEFSALITGRKRHQADTRRALPIVELLDGTLRINPLAAWDTEQLATYTAGRTLPAHPLVEQGYASIGCWPCTRAIQPGESERDGRWSGMDKVECGIHLGRRVAA